MDLTILKSYGIDYEKGLARCLDDRELYETILELFLKDDSLSRAKTALRAQDQRLLFSCTHELKGACGNAELTELYAAVCPLVELLRNGNGNGDLEEINRHFERMEAAYQKAQEGIRLAHNS